MLNCTRVDGPHIEQSVVVRSHYGLPELRVRYSIEEVVVCEGDSSIMSWLIGVVNDTTIHKDSTMVAMASGSLGVRRKVVANQDIIGEAETALVGHTDSTTQMRLVARIGIPVLFHNDILGEVNRTTCPVYCNNWTVCLVGVAHKVPFGATRHKCIGVANFVRLESGVNGILTHGHSTTL